MTVTVEEEGLFSECPVLKRMLDSGTAVGMTGESLSLTSLSAEAAEALYRVVLSKRPSVTIEIGMACGVSSLAILAALQRIGGSGQLISIDPHQSADWKGRGVAAVERAGFEGRHRLIEDFDYSALPSLLGSGQRADFAFIDGWHTFDYKLLDFWYLDRMLEVGGIVGFDDCRFPSVHKTIRFIQSHRKYEEIEVGLPAGQENYAGIRGLAKRVIGLRVLNEFRRVTGRATGIYVPDNRYFRKVEHWEPTWSYFSEF